MTKNAKSTRTRARETSAGNRSLVQADTARRPEPSWAEAQPANAAREAMVAEAAYYRAEKRGFAPGCELEDWLGAEKEIAGCGLECQATAVAELH